MGRLRYEGSVKLAFLLAFVVTVALRLGLLALNVAHRRGRGGAVPAELSTVIDAETARRSGQYQSRLEALTAVRRLVWALLVGVFFFAGGLQRWDTWTLGTLGGGLGQALLFTLGLQWLASLAQLPFDLWSTFRIEAESGFNRMTWPLFASDWLKGNALGSLLAALLVSGGWWLYHALPNSYWLWAWALAMALTLLLMLLSPYVIEPLFIKTTPLADEALARDVQQLAQRAGVDVRQVLQVDASRRTTHSNAYFTGIGRVKRVVLFDTLLQRFSSAELLAVLAHELGHWRHKHITQRLLLSAASSFVLFYCGAQLLQGATLCTALELHGPSLPAQVLVLLFAASLAQFYVIPLSSAWSRAHERQADDFAAALTGAPQDMASALARLAKDNLSSLHPHPWYAAFFYSHPPTAERIRRLLA